VKVGASIRYLRIFQLTCMGILLGMLTACAGPDRPKPADLGPNTALINVRPVWSASIGRVSLPLDVRVLGKQFLVASSDGTVVSIDADTGVDQWRAALGTKLTAGVGSDGRYSAVVNVENELIALEAGKQLWRQRLNALTLTAPLVAGERIFVVSSDKTVSAFDAATGRRLWQQSRSGDALVLGQSGVLLAVGDTLVAGIGGRLVGLSPLNGQSRWEAILASGRGTNEVERLVDLVSGVSRSGNQVCARAFQSAVGCVDSGKGTVLWSKSADGSKGLDGDDSNLYGVEADGRIVAWRRADGERLWIADHLRFRVLSAPLLAGRSIVVGDDSGTLYFLSRQDGTLLNRVTTDGSPLAATPVLVGNTLVAVTQRGGIFGFRPE
jgi:outer membrane protein assembly factor BamB